MKYNQIDPKKISLSTDKISNGWFLITAGEQDDLNTMTANWGGTGVMWGAPVVFVVLRPSRFTYQFVEQNESFSLSFFDYQNAQYKDMLKYMGAHSGRDADKILQCGLTPKFDKDAPYFEESEMSLVCKKRFVTDFDKENFLYSETVDQWYQKGDLHRLYIAEIIEAFEKN